MKAKIDWILRTLVIVMIIGAFIVIKKDIDSKYAFYYVIVSLASLFLFFIYQVGGSVINAIKVSKVTKSLEWIGFKDLILTFFISLIALFIVTTIFKYVIKQDTNVIGTLWTSIAIASGSTIGDFIYKAKSKKSKLS